MRLRPTFALVRAVVLAAGLVICAVIGGRMDLALLAVPFLVHAAWAVTRLPAAGDLPAPDISPRGVAVREGDAVDLTITVPASQDLAGYFISAAFMPAADLLTRPASGAVTSTIAPDGAAGASGTEGTDGGSGTGGATIGVQPNRWGRYPLDPAVVAVTDASGAWQATGRTGRVHVMARPSAEVLEGASGIARPIGVTGLHTSSQRGDGSALADVREFRPGDRLRRINWRVTSRTRSLHVNSTLTDRDTDVLITADTALDTRLGTDGPSGLDLTVRAIAGITQYYTGLGDRVGLHDLGGRIGSLRAGTGPRQTRLIMDRLSRADRSAQASSRFRPVPRLRSGTLVFYCSPLLTDDALSELVRLRRLGGEVIAVDTMPESVGHLEGHAPADPTSYLDEAWAIRSLQRQLVIARLRQFGIPVTPWRGPASLAAVLLALGQAREAPHLGIGSGGGR